MLAIGCIQAQKCHTDTCPTGVATQNPWLARGLVPQEKSERLARYVQTLRRDLIKVSEAAGVPHPALLGPDDVDFVGQGRTHASLRETYGYEEGWGLPGEEVREQITRIMVETTAYRPAADRVVQHEPLPHAEGDTVTA